MTLTVLELESAGGSVPGKAKRRRFSAEYKARVLAEYESLPVGSAQRGALLRRENLYTSHLQDWANARDRKLGVPEGHTAAQLKAATRDAAAEDAEVRRLRRRLADTESELARTRTALEIVGKVHALLEQLSESADTEPPSKP